MEERFLHFHKEIDSLGTGPVSANYRRVPFFSRHQATFYVLNK